MMDTAMFHRLTRFTAEDTRSPLLIRAVNLRWRTMTSRLPPHNSATPTLRLALFLRPNTHLATPPKAA